MNTYTVASGMQRRKEEGKKMDDDDDGLYFKTMRIKAA